MSIEFDQIEGGVTARVAAGYSLKIPAEADYSSHDAHVTYSVEFPALGLDLEGIKEELETLEAQLHTNAKLAVFAQLGVEFEMGPAGALAPVLKSKPKAPARPRAAAAGSGSRYGGSRPAPKSAGYDLPIVTLGGIDYRDQRPLKDEGVYKDRAADFKSVDKQGNGQFAQLWIVTKDGEPNQDVADLMEEAGIE